MVRRSLRFRQLRIGPGAIPVCWWENDVFISSDNEPSDENHGLTLSQGRENVRRFGTCDPRMKR